MRWTALRAVLPALGAILWVLEQAGGAVSAMPRAELTFQQVVVSIMLFDSWSVEHQGTWKGHPFHASNNIDGINGDPDNNGLGIETHTLKIPAVTKLQEAYARKIVDTVNDLDNVLYEVSNESEYGADWHNHFAKVINDYEATKPKRHPVGITLVKGPLPGQVVIDPEHPQWLMRQGGEHLFVWPPGDPEGFLYVGKRNPDGTRDGDQVQRIRKLVEHGGNCIYMQIVRTHGGDARPDRTHNPFVDSDPAQGPDPDILNQWEEWFTLMDRNDILIYLFFYDDGARPWDTGDRVGPQEKAFLETIVKRFQHHRNLIWIVGEESEERYSTARVQAMPLPAAIL